jgi:hypothetical protein
VLVSEGWDGGSKSDPTQEVPHMNHKWKMAMVLGPELDHDHFHITPYYFTDILPHLL